LGIAPAIQAFDFGEELCDLGWRLHPSLVQTLVQAWKDEVIGRGPDQRFPSRVPWVSSEGRFIVSNELLGSFGNLLFSAKLPRQSLMVAVL